jgi:phosphate butyryltransferase
MDTKATIENRTYEEIKVGDTASLTRTLTTDDIQLFAAMSGDVNPAHLDPAYAATDIFHKVIVHGMWGGGLISAVLGTELPGPGTIYLGQSLRFRHPVAPGDTITATVTVTEKQDTHHLVTLDCRCTNQTGDVVIGGEAQVMAPLEKISRPRMALPEIRIIRHERYRLLLAQAAGGEPVAAAIVHPCDITSISGAAQAASAGLITPVLVGPEEKIRRAARDAGVDLAPFRLVAVPHSHAAAAESVRLAASGEVKLLVKGSLHTDELMSAVLASASGLKTDRRVSHVYLMDVPGYPRPLLVTDAAINIEPTLEEKADIVRNAIDLAHVIGIATPRVAILAAVETVNPKMRSTIDAAALCKMADRGQIVGGLLDGPLAFDNAISESAAKEKGIVSDVAGRADILLVPNLEAGNMIAKQLTFLGGADAAGVVLGTRIPIMLTSRADSLETRLASAALAVLLTRTPTKAAAGV